MADDPLATRIGRRTVGENLDRAVTAGVVVRAEDGTLVLPSSKGGTERTMYSDVRWPFPCTKLLFLFEHAYGRSQVPSTCRICFKVKVKPRTVSELVAVYDATVHKPYPSKYQPDMYVTYSQDLYGAYFYAEGLEAARAIYRDVRATLDADERLRAVPMEIKRGCTDYEMYCGPSDRYTFPEGLAEIEALLLDQITVTPAPAGRPARRLILAQWIQMAYRIGDETYLELTGGRRLFPKTVTYEP
jgi:uncharacterized protein (DUF2164 family)